MLRFVGRGCFVTATEDKKLSVWTTAQATPVVVKKLPEVCYNGLANNRYFALHNKQLHIVDLVNIKDPLTRSFNIEGIPVGFSGEKELFVAQRKKRELCLIDVTNGQELSRIAFPSTKKFKDSESYWIIGSRIAVEENPSGFAVFDLKTGKLQRIVEYKNKHAIRAPIALSPNEQILLVGLWHCVAGYDVSSGKLLWTMPIGDKWGMQPRFLTNECAIIGRGVDNWMFNPNSGKEIKILPNLPYIHSIHDIDPDGLLLYKGYSEINLRLPNGVFVVPDDVDRHSSRAKGLAFLESEKKSAIVVAADSICVYSLNGKLEKRFAGTTETGAGQNVSVSRNGVYAAGREGTKLRVWEVDSGKLRSELEHPIEGEPVAVSDDGNFVLTTGVWGIADLLGIWDLKQRRVIERKTWGEDDLFDVYGCFLEDESVLAVGEGGIIVRADRYSGASEVLVDGSCANVTCMIPGRDQLLYAGAGFKAEICDLNSGKKVTKLKGPAGSGEEDEGYYAVSACRNILAVGGTNSSVRLYRAGEQKSFVSFRHKSGITALAFDRIGRYLAVGTADGRVEIWQITK